MIIKLGDVIVDDRGNSALIQLKILLIKMTVRTH